MDFKTLKINNFLTMGEASVELDNRGLILVQGVNEDDSSAGSNGAGKSTIVDALCWALYGTTARGLTGDQIVNRKAKKETSVTILLEEGGMVYSVTRHRKHSVHKNALIVTQRDLGTGVETDLTKGTDKETQQVVVDILGCTLDVFCGAVYAGQEQMPDLPGMTDKQLKTLLEEASGTETLARAYVEARQRLMVTKTRSEGIVKRLEDQKSRSELVAADLITLEANFKLHEDSRKDRAREHMVKVKPVQESIDARKAKIAAADRPAIEKELAEAKARLEGHSDQGKKLAELSTAVANATRASDHAKHAGAQLGTSIKSQKQGLDEVEKLIGTPCGECGKNYCAHDLEAAKTARVTRIATLQAEAVPARQLILDTTAAYEEAQKAFDTFKAGMTDVSGDVAVMGKLNNELSALDQLARDIATEENNIEVHRSNAKRELTSPNPWAEPIELKKAEQVKAAEAIAAAAAEVAKAEEELELYEDAVKVFGPAGVRAQILDTVTPFLNEQTREYLGALSDGNCHAVWSTLTTTAKGELREKFNIEVTHDHGGESFAALSGGEKRKVRLASFMALQDLVASRATKPLNLFIADEIDHALDDSGLERLMGTLERKAKERGTVLVISHNELADWIPNNITVRKKGGVSSVDAGGAAY